MESNGASSHHHSALLLLLLRERKGPPRRCFPQILCTEMAQVVPCLMLACGGRGKKREGRPLQMSVPCKAWSSAAEFEAPLPSPAACSSLSLPLCFFIFSSFLHLDKRSAPERGGVFEPSRKGERAATPGNGKQEKAVHVLPEWKCEKSYLSPSRAEKKTRVLLTLRCPSASRLTSSAPGSRSRASSRPRSRRTLRS